MAKGKPTPEKSKIERDRPLAYSRRQKGSDGDDKDAPKAEAAKSDSGKTEATDAADSKAEAPKAADAKAEAPNTEASKVDAKADAKSDAKDEASKAEAPKAEAAKSDAPTGDAPATEAKADEPPAIDPPPPKGEPWPDATPQPMRPVEAPVRARTETVGMPPELVVGAPPAMPAGTIEDPPFMPGPRQIPDGAPGDPAPVPGRAPPGDSRSFRKDNEFALVYRVQTALITRVGVVGTRGVWRVVEYPTSTSASNAYAKECSRFVSEGFSDYRD